jgi:hypothetical protein
MGEGQGKWLDIGYKKCREIEGLVGINHMMGTLYVMVCSDT